MPKPPRSLLRQVAASVDAPPVLAPYLGELFADLTALGSMPRTVVRLLREAGIGEGARVLDLACGKGAVSVAIAANLGCRVLGLDAYEPFLESARELARRRGVGGGVGGMGRVRRGEGVAEFRHFNLRDPSTLPRGRFDAALMIGLDPLVHAAAVLRPLTRRGGVYVIDDVYRDDRDPRAGEYPHIPTRAESREILTAAGDEIAAVHIPTPSEIRRLNDRLYRGISRRAAALRRRHPRLATALREYLARQRHANEELVGPLRPAIWVVRRR